MPAAKKKQRKSIESILSKHNFILFGVAALVIMTGYWALSQKPVDGFLTLTVAPVLLVIGYCIIIPYAIMKSPKVD